MRRTRSVAAAFAGSVCLAALAPAAVAYGPVAEVSPHRVRPGGTVTVTVICPKHDAKKVTYITAYSQAFEDGEADLKLLPRGGQQGRPTFSGKARITSAHHFPGPWSSESFRSSSDSQTSSYGSEEESADGSTEDFGTESSRGSGEDYGSGNTDGPEDPSSGENSPGSYANGSYAEESYGSHADGSFGSQDSYGSGSSRHPKRYGINGSCPDGSDFTTSVLVERKPRGGAHAGQGGSQGSVNTAAVAAGGALVCATVGFGVHALRRRRSES